MFSSKSRSWHNILESCIRWNPSKMKHPYLAPTVTAEPAARRPTAAAANAMMLFLCHSMMADCMSNRIGIALFNYVALLCLKDSLQMTNIHTTVPICKVFCKEGTYFGKERNKNVPSLCTVWSSTVHFSFSIFGFTFTVRKQF